MYSVHRRRFSYPSDVVRPWLDRVWSEDEAPVFPVDVVRPFRQNPPDEDAGALIPFRTLLGHGPLPFLYVGGDKTSFRVVTPFDGSHAFEIVPDGDGCVLVHTLSIPAPRAVEAIW